MNNFDKKNPVALGLQQDGSTNEFVEGYNTNNFNIDLFDSQVSDINKEITDRFEPKKQQSDYLSLVYQYLDMCRRAERVSTCGSVLEFGIYPDKARLQFANFCKDRLCPMCNWRRSLKLYGQVSAVMDVLEQQGYQFLFLTLTIKNCSASDLPKTIDVLLKGFKHLFNDNRRIRKSIKGFFRSLEITKNKKTGEYHPHLHCILAVSPSYFKKSSEYIKQSEWAEIWQKCIDVDYNPIIDIRRIKPNISAVSDALDLKNHKGDNGISSAVREVAKYSVKGSDFLDFNDLEKSADTVSDFLKAISFRRLASFTGIFSKVRKQLELDDVENGNLVQTDVDNLRSDVAIAIVRYGYKNGCYTLENFSKGGVKAG